MNSFDRIEVATMIREHLKGMMFVADGNRPENKTGAVLPDCLKGYSTKDIWGYRSHWTAEDWKQEAETMENYWYKCIEERNDALDEVTRLKDAAQFEGKTAKEWYDELSNANGDHLGDVRLLNIKIDGQREAIKRCISVMTTEQIHKALEDK